MTVIINNQGLVQYYQGWLKEDISIDSVTKNLIWRSDKIKIFGKEYEQSRKVAWYGDESVTYKYSGIEMNARVWTPELFNIKSQIEKFLEVNFNSVLVNLYRDGKDSMGWHADDEKELGDKPVIASLSLGVTRDFVLKHKKTAEKKYICLHHGDLLVMRGETQTFWKHSIPKRLKLNGPRLNLTFRNIYSL